MSERETSTSTELPLVDLTLRKRKTEDVYLEEPDYKKIALLALNELFTRCYGEQLGLDAEEMMDAFDFLFREDSRNKDGTINRRTRSLETDMTPQRLQYLEYIVAFDKDPELTYSNYCALHGFEVDEDYV